MNGYGYYAMKSKKAAMELSVTAIVILILAIVMLGLGLGFIRGMFSKVSTSFDEQISAEPEPPTASRADPLTLSRESLITTAGETLVLKVEAFNPTASDLLPTTAPTISCNFRGTPIDAAALGVSANDKAITQGESEVYNVVFSTPTTQAPGTLLCSAEVAGVSQKDFTIEVK